MKILYISNSRIPTEKGYGIQIFKMCQAFSGLGIDVELILPTRKNKPFKGIDPFDYYQVERSFKVKKIKCFDPDWLMRFPNGIYIKFQAALFLISLFFYLLFKSDRGEYIFYTRDEYLLPILQWFSNQVGWEAHTLPTNKKHYLKYWQRCFKIITITQGLKNELIKLDIKEDKILVAPDGVDLDKFQPQVVETKKEIRQKLNLPLDKNIIMYTGHFYDWKGVQTLANAAQLLSDDKLVVFVGGDDFYLRKFKLRNKNYKNILILGHRPYKQIPFYLKSADILVLPNSAQQPQVNWTSPLKMFEYMAAQKPIVASDLPSLREILNKNNALLVEADNPRALSDGIKKILINQDLSDKIILQASRDVQNYTWEKRAEKIIKFINQ